jgi:hypothetical protein
VREIFPAPRGGWPEDPEKRRIFDQLPSWRTLAQVLRFHTNEINVVRVAILSIVLTLTVGQNAALLCNAWCHPVEGTTAAECRHPNTSPRVTSNDECKDATVAPIALVREEGRRGSSAPRAQPEVAVSRLAFVAAAVAASSDHRSHHHVLPAARPVVRPLRV